MYNFPLVEVPEWLANAIPFLFSSESHSLVALLGTCLGLVGGFGFIIPPLMDHFFCDPPIAQSDLRWSFVARGVLCFAMAALSVIFGSMALIIATLFVAVALVWYYRAKRVNSV